MSCVGINLLAKMLVVCEIIVIQNEPSTHAIDATSFVQKAMLRELWRKSCGCWRYLQLADPAKIGKETTNLQSLTKQVAHICAHSGKAVKNRCAVSFQRYLLSEACLWDDYFKVTEM